MRFSPDGALLATTGDDRTARLWRVPDGTQLTVLTGHSDVLNRCAFSPEGTLLATTSDDRTARPWRVPDGTQLALLDGHQSWVEGCVFSPDGTLLGTVGSDGTVRLWDAAKGRCHCTLRVAGPLVGIAWHPNGITLSAVGGRGVYVLSYFP